MQEFHATTICAVRHGGKTARAGDGQVTMGESVVMKATARKIRKMYHGKVLAGFAQTAFWLMVRITKIRIKKLTSELNTMKKKKWI